jgi:MH1 domain
MFMFRSKRTHLTQRLLKVRKLDAAQEDALQTHVLAQLADAQLQLLLRAVERGDARTCCVPAPRRRRQQRDAADAASSNVTASAAAYCCCSSGESPPPSGATRTPPPPHVLCCQTYRWPQLTPDTQLKRLPQCTTCDCCNPFHWSIVCGPGECP